VAPHGVPEGVQGGYVARSMMAVTAERVRVAHVASFLRCLKTCLKIYIVRAFVKEFFWGYLGAQQSVRERKNCVSGTTKCAGTAKFSVQRTIFR
jgi:hypothetical protein